MKATFFSPFRLVVLLALATWGVCAFGAPTAADEVISPKAEAQKTITPADGPGSGALTAVAVILFAGAGGWMLWRGKGGALAQLNRSPRKLAVEETRSLGNRQYLVVATYENKKFLLGVCPGKIDLLAPLSAPDSTEEKSGS
jgi:flagellar protein FliO/FliZ